jgi:NADPH:quinone reductase-like Zn-dependent oxidoreductase
LFGLQFALALGARAIITSRDVSKLERARELGATEGIDTRRQPDWDKAVLDLTGGRGANHILELVSGENLSRSLRASSGRISQIGILGALQAEVPMPPLILKQVVLRGIVVGHRRVFEAMSVGIEAMKIKPVIDAVYAFDQVPQAFAHLDRGPFGKVVIKVS